MIRSDVYNYINVLDKAADASWLRNEAISNNIANVDTPNYKRQDVSFEAELQHALGASKFRSMDDKVADLNGERLSHIEPRTYIGTMSISIPRMLNLHPTRSSTTPWFRASTRNSRTLSLL